MNEYVEECDRLYRAWSRDELGGAGWLEPEARKALGTKVSYDHAPEPYLAYDGADLSSVEAPLLVFLTTNPGGPRDFQTRVQAGGRATYFEFQNELVNGPYGNESVEKIGRSASRRIERMREIAERLKPITGSTGFVQCEAVPFHSASLPNKLRLAKWLRAEGTESELASYHAALKSFLRNHHVISLDASNSPTSVGWGGWLRVKADLFDFDPSTAKAISLSRSKEERDSTCVFIQPKDDLVRACYLTQGGNDFRNHIPELCAALRSSCTRGPRGRV